MIGVYTLGFVLPFLAVGLFTTTVLEFFKNHMKVVKYTVKAGGVLMILMGVLMFTGKMNSVTGYLSKLTPSNVVEEKKEDSVPGEKTDTEEETGDSTKDSQKDSEAEKDSQIVPSIDFTLQDQYGQAHTLSDYKGKTVFLNFWATWCPPCKAEMPDIQKIYESYEQEGEEALVVLGVAAPNTGGEGSEEEIQAFLEKNGYTYPVLMDTTGEVFASYGISSYPTTFMIDREGNVFGYVSGMLSEDVMRSIIKQTMDGKRE